MTDLLLREAQTVRAGARSDEDYEVVAADGTVIGRLRGSGGPDAHARLCSDARGPPWSPLPTAGGGNDEKVLPGGAGVVGVWGARLRTPYAPSLRRPRCQNWDGNSDRERRSCERTPRKVPSFGIWVPFREN